jgi:hypothetical protein
MPYRPDVDFSAGDLVEIANEIARFCHVQSRPGAEPRTAEDCARTIIPMVFKLVRETVLEEVAKEYWQLGMSHSWPDLSSKHPDIKHSIMLQVDGVLAAAERLLTE